MHEVHGRAAEGHVHSVREELRASGMRGPHRETAAENVQSQKRGPHRVIAGDHGQVSPRHGQQAERLRSGEWLSALRRPPGMDMQVCMLHDVRSKLLTAGG